MYSTKRPDYKTASIFPSYRTTFHASDGLA